MRAAEKLIADNGIENVSIRGIVEAAGQKNESALQYHFQNLNGLIKAIHASRNAEIQARRAVLLASLDETGPAPALREICRLMVEPAYQLAKSKPDFRRYVKAFGHEISLTDRSAVALVSEKGGQGAQQIGALLRVALAHLDDAAYQRRTDGAVRFIAASMFHQARRRNAFRGVQAELFFHSLLDALAGLLGAAESAETKAIAESMKKS
jgi:AcrR family transcriptional regulator